MSYYPPGVTGREFAIAGWDREVEEVRDVEECRDAECASTWEGPITVEGVLFFFGREVQFGWDCPVCGTDNQDDVSVAYDDERDYEPDYDD